MKLLLDENLPRKLKKHFSEFNVYTVVEVGWSGLKNGVLLERMLKEEFDVLITGDKNIEHQQNFQAYPIPVIVLHVKYITYPDIVPIIPQVLACLTTQLPPGPTIIKSEK